jgi:hypothetical protein
VSVAASGRITSSARRKFVPLDVFRIQTAIALKTTVLSRDGSHQLWGLPQGQFGDSLLVRQILSLHTIVSMRAGIHQLHEGPAGQPTGRPRFSVSAFRLSGRGVF